MIDTKSNQNGFALIWLIAVISVVVLAGLGIAWRIKNTNQKTTPPPTQTRAPEEKQTTTKPQPQTIAFISHGAIQDGIYVIASAELPESSSGICSFGFNRGDAVRSKEISIHNTTSCQAVIPREEFPYGGLWDMSVFFLSNDSLTTAISDKKQFYITP